MFSFSVGHEDSALKASNFSSLMPEEHREVFFRARLARKPWEYMKLFQYLVQQLPDKKENFFTRP